VTTTCRSEVAPATVLSGVICRVAFASCYVYSPNGTGVESERSRVLRELLKAGEARVLFYYADRLRRELDANASLASFLGPSSVLVPVPGSARTCAGERLITERLAAAFIAEGLGKSIWRGVHRVRRVRKSATALPGSRPTMAEHYDSFAVERGVAAPSRIILVDDVVTKGRTLLAAAMRLREAFPTSDIRAFALLRTMGLGQKVGRLMDPCVGEIRCRAGDAFRTP
jgi:predicted amidophosphoribosyltransferase